MAFKRNLIYFICPFKSNNEWLLNILELKKYMNVFNHKKIVVVAQGEGLIPLSIIKKEFEDQSIYFYTMPNDRKLGEVEPFKKMLKKVYSIDPCEITFYAHAKGVSPKYQNRTNKEYMKNIRIWRNVMYHYCLRDVAFIEAVLSDFSCCGCFKREIGIGHPSSKWYFAGTYFWFNNKNIFSKEDWNIRGNKWAVEGYLGTKFAIEEGFCLFGEYKPTYHFIHMSMENWDSMFINPLGASDFLHGISEGKII